MRSTKIVATVGPASDSEEKLEEISDAGVDVLRFNFSHVDHETHGKIFDRVKELDLDVATMLDTKGPEHRTGEMEDIKVEKGEEIKLGGEGAIPVRYERFSQHVSEGDKILLNDGKVELVVLDVYEGTVLCNVVHGGTISSGDSINVPGKDMGLNAPTEKDVRDIRFGCEKGYDFVSVSFVKSAEDVKNVRKILEENDSDMQVISKIEHFKAVENLDEIIEVSDGIMVARGDLGVETPSTQLPLLQKKIIKKCNRRGKPVITATQLLQSMTENPRATRAETSDVANAVLDGTDAVMLSEETAVGDHPVRSVDYMSKVVEKVEEEVKSDLEHIEGDIANSITDSICRSVWKSSEEMDAEMIIAHTSSGYTARNTAKFRPSVPVLAFTDSRSTRRQLKLVWGVEPVYTEYEEHFQDMIIEAAEKAEEIGYVEENDLIVFTAGVPESVPGNTNIMEIRRLSEVKEEKEERNK